MKKIYKVIFNKDEKNFEEFETLEKAKEFAKEYANTEVKKCVDEILFKIHKKPEFEKQEQHDILMSSRK